MSAFYDLASVVLVPSGYKSGKIYAQKPLTTDGQLTFTRASTATRVNASGLIETVASGVPRLDYTNSTCPKLLLEPQQTNLIIYSEDMITGKVRNNVTATNNVTTAPDGATTAASVEADGVSTVFIRTSAKTFGAVNFSLYLKYDSQQFVQIIRSADNDCFVNFDIQNGVIGDAGAKTTNVQIENVGNGWYRCSAYLNASAAGTLRVYHVSSLSAGFAASSTTIGNTYFTWGWQAEENAYATSYVKTEAAAVTRLADAASKTGISSLIGQTEGTFYAELEVIGGITSAAFYVRNPSGGNYGEYMALYFNADKYPTFEVRTGNTEQAVIRQLTAYSTGIHKIAGAYKANDFVLYVDGVQVGSDTSGSIPALSELYLGTYVDNGVRSHTKKQALVFPTRLTNAQLAELTTL